MIQSDSLESAKIKSNTDNYNEHAEVNVEKLGSSIYRINHYPANKRYGNQLC